MITTEESEIILQLRDEKPNICWPGYWSLLGGQIEPGETAMEAVLREIHEEAGIAPAAIVEVAVTPHDPAKTPPHVFLGTWGGSEGDLILGEGQALKLFPLDALPDRMPPHIRDYITQLGDASAIQHGAGDEG
ncbi:NUDIX domain-containing protein [Streptomyces sp. NBC_00091]|uniref:NUDIX domain-containing protein n=1 Tax=Streptomyces sp. NBC_00091 TaxID=2975648 RepID=UPI002250E829|nr:NUDIX domain-containing protein [Streptomyces sp. NBC_00091]MCX5376135.1 NUDIX domain-containing protein [Streptomyces sp. NBC_00091]